MHEDCTADADLSESLDTYEVNYAPAPMHATPNTEKRAPKINFKNLHFPCPEQTATHDKIEMIKRKIPITIHAYPAGDALKLASIFAGIDILKPDRKSVV